MYNGSVCYFAYLRHIYASSEHVSAPRTWYDSLRFSAYSHAFFDDAETAFFEDPVEDLKAAPRWSFDRGYYDAHGKIFRCLLHGVYLRHPVLLHSSQLPSFYLKVQCSLDLYRSKQDSPVVPSWIFCKSVEFLLDTDRTVQGHHLVALVIE